MRPVVNVYRNGLVESLHHGSVAVVDARGRLLAFVGDPGFETFIRSAAKPLQAMPLLEAGGVEAYDLDRQEVALICASHGGEAHHVSTAAGLLRRLDLDEDDLVCAAHPPYDASARAELEEEGIGPTPLHNNCSGNHAGLMLASELLGLSVEKYAELDSELQRRVHRNVAEFADLSPEEVERGVDGCGVPAFRMSLYRAALAYARLGERAFDPEAQLHEECRTVFEAMTVAPEYVAGGWSMTTPLITRLEGHVLAKEGAEGFYAMALDPEASAIARDACGAEGDDLIGIAIKIGDGSSERSRNPVVIRTLQLLALDLTVDEELARFVAPEIYNLEGDKVGEARAEFDLSFL